MFPSLAMKGLPIEPHKIPIPQYKFTLARSIGNRETTTYKSNYIMQAAKATEKGRGAAKNCERITEYLPDLQTSSSSSWAAANMLRYAVLLLLLLLLVVFFVIAPNSHPLAFAHEHTFRKQ